MSHALLLRLFLSPYFNISVAMHYLKTYPDSIGISHYLCYRMRSMKAEDVEFYWPQICHLLVTRPTESNALECFVLERAEESTHSAMLTFWFMQTALKDLIAQRQTNPVAFQVCQRVLHRCHEIIFGDPPEPSASPYRSLPASPRGSYLDVGRTITSTLTGVASPRRTLMASTSNPPALRPTTPASSRPGPIRRLSNNLRDKRNKRRINAHIPPALVGMGVVLAGTPGMPALEGITGQVALMQGRKPRDDLQDTKNRVEIDNDQGADAPRGGGEELTGRNAGDGSPQSDGEEGGSDDDNEGAGTRDVVPKSTNKGGDSQKLRLGTTFATSSVADLSASGQSPETAITPSPGQQVQEKAVRGSKPALLHRNSLHPSHTSPSLIETPRMASTANLPSPKAALGTNKAPASPLRRQALKSMTSSSSTPRLTQPAPFSSVPTLGQTSRRDTLFMPMPSADMLLATYDVEAQRQLLRSHYCRSEFRFLSALEDISNRLLVIPKPARISALRAELTSLNHNLPAEVCMPMWCAADHSHEEGGETPAGLSLATRPDKHPKQHSRAHHRVVRISPGDSVVLNSAERAPYLVHVEILENDLDFDPASRQNRDLLRKIVIQEELKKRKRQGIETTEMVQSANATGKFDSLGWTPPTPFPNQPQRKTSLNAHKSAQKSDPTKDGSEVEEVDLVEQLFGSNFSIHNQPPDLAESIPMPLGPQNKLSDAVAWSKGSTTPALPAALASALPAPTAHQEDKLSPFPSPDAQESSNPIEGTSSKTESETSLDGHRSRPVITLEDYSERMRTAAVMLAQLNASMMPVRTPNAPDPASNGGALGWITGSGSLATANGGPSAQGEPTPVPPAHIGAGKLRLAPAEATAIRDRIMAEMMSLEEERVTRMTAQPDGYTVQPSASDGKTAEDESIIRRELNKADPSAVVFKESWSAKKSRIRAASPWGHLAAWDVLSVIVKTGADLRQEQLATQLIERFGQIWKEEKVDCWVRFFKILITGDSSGLVETITDAVSVHSIKKSEYARRIAEGNLGNVTLLDHFVHTYGEQHSGRFARAQRNFIKSLAGYSVVTYLLQIKDRHNGNILVDRDGHLIHIDFGFMLSNSPGNMKFEAAPFKLPMEYIEIMGGLDSPGFAKFKQLFKEGFEAARKHSDSILTIVELMQKDSKLDCFALFGEQTSQHLRDRFQLGLTQAAVDAYLERLIVSSIGSSWTRLYDSFQYYSQGVL
ncbi:Phosphatidylinositol 4-kinase pik1alpha (PI4-kinase)(PtdIns-4-kinase) [Naganishia albida]|nr:Phosphatidylinositol 4-kinase pik1alpha (PI4-kinase)(PtdIns-4-kinase) [Naganishia albida]